MMFAQYVGASWEARGCWQLLRRVYAEQLGLELPSYAEEYGDGSGAAALILAESVAWHAVPPGGERPGDAALFSMAGDPAHVGVVVGAGRFLHIREGQTATIESYRGPIWSRRLVGFFRHAEAP